MLGIVVLHDVCTVRVPAIVTGRIPWSDSSKLGEAKLRTRCIMKTSESGICCAFVCVTVFKLWIDMDWMIELTCSVFEGLFAFIFEAGILLCCMMWFPQLLAQFHALSVKLCWIVLSHAMNQLFSRCVCSLKEERAEVNGRNWQGQTPLMVSAGHGHVSLDLLDLEFWCSCASKCAESQQRSAVARSSEFGLSLVFEYFTSISHREQMPMLQLLTPFLARLA